MIVRRLLHIEWHPWRRPIVRLKHLPRSGDVVWNGDILCVLERCRPCGEGFLARELTPRVDRHAPSSRPSFAEFTLPDAASPS